VSPALTLYRAPYSTNVERVALALAHKRLAVESVVIDYADRSEVQRVSGQPLVPVLVDGGRAISDSKRILEHLERIAPDPALYPTAPAESAAMAIFIDWFDRVWKEPPNRIEATLAGAAPNAALVAELSTLMQARLALFHDLLDGRDFLFGDTLSAADCVAFPFLRFALRRDPGDDELFHRVLDEHQTLTDEHGRLARWIRRIDALPRA